MQDFGGRMEYGYNARNFRTLFRDGEGNETRCMYDGMGYGYEYDAAGNLTRVMSPEGNQEAAYTYDLCGNILTYTDAMNRTTHCRYDLGKHLVQVLRPAEEKEGRILYQKISFSYDENGNKTKEVRHGGYWNEEGNLAEKSGTDLCLTFVYKARNRLIRIEAGPGG